jgi:glutamate-1-semialdehyde 2,1-aminomutase
VYQAGTLSGNPLATAAGLAVLDLVGDREIAALSLRVGQFASDLGAAISAHGLEVDVPTVGPLLSIYFTATPISDYEGARVAATNGRYAQFFRAMLERSIAFAPSPYEVAFPSLAHSDRDFDRTVEVAGIVAKSLASRGISTAL